MMSLQITPRSVHLFSRLACANIVPLIKKNKHVNTNTTLHLEDNPLPFLFVRHRVGKCMSTSIVNILKEEMIPEASVLKTNCLPH